MIWFSSAAGIRMSQSTSRTSALVMSVRAGEALDGAVLGLPGDDPVDVEPVGLVDAAGRVADRDDRRAFLADQPGGDRAGVAEALDGDRGPFRSMPRWAAASTMQKTAPRAVASLRPSEPPRAIGLPVTTPGTV